jgi:WD40 repeat protein/3',5'-cyclic AMP phosphodiesterase CpdA
VAVTIVHLSDLRFGWRHRFGSLAPPTVDDTFEALTAAFHEDLGKVRDAKGGAVEPDLLVLSGDLTENARPSELRDVLRFADSLARGLGLPRHRVVVIPGNRDVSRDACAAYFSNCRAEEREPAPPFWPKWRFFASFFRDFYKDHSGASFNEHHPWSLFEVPDLRVTVAGLNSTQAESHEDHRGWLGKDQLHWFAFELEQARHSGWLRLAVLHHDPHGAPTRPEESLQDAGALKEIVAPHANLVLHGHSHGEEERWLVPELPCLAAGTPETGAEPVNRYQIVQVFEDHLRRWTRVCEPGRAPWREDTRGTGRIPVRLRQVEAVFQEPPGTLASAGAAGAKPVAADPDDLLARVARILRLREPKAEVERRSVPRPALEYLRVTVREGGLARSFPVGVVDHTVTPQDLTAFVEGVHSRYQEEDSGVISRLVYFGSSLVAGKVAMQAREQRVLLVRLSELEQLIDFRPLLDRQAQRLADDTLYPSHLYVPQRMRLVEGGGSRETNNALTLIQSWITSSEEGRFILVLGDSGTGKSFLLRELTRRVGAESDVVPILIEMRTLNKSRSLDELLGQHFGQEGFDFSPLRFRYLLERGRIALLFDGFDELATLVTYDRAADHLATLRQAALGAAKVVVTSRRQHFLSDRDLLTDMGEQVEHVSGRRVSMLLPFDAAQIADFLERRWGSKEEAARRLRLFEEVRVLGLAANPRLLGFISDLREEQLRSAGGGTREISKPEIYQMLIQRWLGLETDRANPKGSRPGLSVEQRWQAVTDVALRMWRSPDHAINLNELTEEVAQVLRTLSDRERDTAAFQVGSGTLLVRDEHGSFSFIHPSILEWLVARQASEDLKEGKSPEILARGAASDLMLEFFAALAGKKEAVRWAHQALNDPLPAISEKAQRLLGLFPEEAGRQRRMVGQDLQGRDFSDQDFTRADFSESDLSGARLLNTVLSSARFRGARLVRADLSRARLDGADLGGADLSGARLLEADLRGASLDGTVLRRAKLIGASWDPDAFKRCETYGAALELPAAVPAVVGCALPVAAVAWSPNGELVAAAAGNAVDLWDTQSWKPIRRLTGALDRVRCLAFTPAGTILAAGSEDGTALTWDLATGEMIVRVGPHRDAVCGLALKQEGRILATASADGTAVIWDARSGQELVRLPGHQGAVRCADFSPDGLFLVTGADDRTIRFWDAATGREAQSLQQAGVPLCLGYSPEGMFFAAGCDDRLLRIWRRGEKNEVWCPLEGTALALAFSPDGRQVALAVDDGTVRVWDLALMRETYRLAGHEAAVRGVAFRPDSRALVSGSDDRTLRIWSGGQGERLAGFRCGVRRLGFRRDGSLLSVLEDDTLRVWDLATGNALQRPGGDSVWQRSQHRNLKARPELDTYLQKQGRGLVMALSPDGTSLATGSQDRTVRLWDLESRSQDHALEGHRGDIRSLAFSPDGQTLASASADRTLRIWPAKGMPLTLSGHRDVVTHVAFGPEGKRLASASFDGTVRLWSVELGRELRSLPGHPGPVLAVAFSPDGKRLASACQDRSVRVWGIEAGRELAAFPGPRGPLTLAFSPDGAALAAAGEDGSVWIWTPEPRRLTGHVAAVRDLVFSPDRRLLASGSDDNTIRLWDTQTWECLAVLAPLREGWAAIRPDGRFRHSKATGFWHAVGLCRFEPGELEAWLTLKPGEPLFEPAARREPA